VADDVIKSYLMALGFQVDNVSFNKMQDTLKKLDDTVKQKTSGMAKDYAIASTAIVSSLSSIAFATVDLLDKVAQADLGYQKFALRMYMARDAAKSFKIVTDSMGESINDIAWMPELQGRYKSLMGEAAKMNTPKDAEGQLRYIRDIRYEFTRLKVEATYGLQWVGYYLFKYLNDPITGAKSGFKDLNDWIQEKMPEWTEKIARWLAMLTQLGGSAWRAVKALAGEIESLYNRLPEWGKGLITFGAIITAIFMAGPIGRAILAISTLVLLIDDFYAYIDGRKSNPQLAPIWEKLLDYSHRISRSVAMTVFYIGELNRTAGAGGILEGIFDPKRWEGIEERKANFLKFWEDKNPPLKRGGGSGATGLAGIARQESQGNYGAVGQYIPGRGMAIGKYQIMPENWPKWAVQAGLAPNAPATPENQERVARAEWARLHGKYGSNDLAAAAWYGGEKVADRLSAGDMSALRTRPNAGIAGPNVGEYIKQTQGHEFNVTNNIDLTFNGPTSDEQVRQIESIVRKYNSKETLMGNRFPAFSGVTP
jgi:hypothetical protein